MMLRGIPLKSFRGIVAVALATCVCTMGQRRSGPVDPGVRGGPAGAGTPLKGLTADETAFFQDGLARFAEIEAVTKGDEQWPRSALQLQPVFVLPLAAGCRRIEPGAKPPDRSCQP